jgi:ribonuclease T1
LDSAESELEAIEQELENDTQDYEDTYDDSRESYDDSQDTYNDEEGYDDQEDEYDNEDWDYKDTYAEDDQETIDEQDDSNVQIYEDGEYTSKEEVAAYIHQYGKLPSNYITKKKAEKLGWNSKKGNLDEVAPGKSIGGSHFGNYQGSLPDGDYKECDINYTGGYRGAERIIYSTDGRVYYTNDHYETFEQLY